MEEMLNSELITTIIQVGRLIKGKISASSSIANLSILQVQALMFLELHKDASMTEIAKHFSIKLSSATSLIDNLNDMKLILREVDTKDRRLVRIHITKKGESLLQKAKQEQCKRMEKNLSYLSVQDKKQLLAILGNLAQKLEESYE